MACDSCDVVASPEPKQTTHMYGEISAGQTGANALVVNFPGGRSNVYESLVPSRNNARNSDIDLSKCAVCIGSNVQKPVWNASRFRSGYNLAYRTVAIGPVRFYSFVGQSHRVDGFESIPRTI